MYQKYQTEVLVLASRESGEADRALALYTREFGLVRARASALRSERSKMRYALQDLSRANVGLVRGKRGWRLAGASAIAYPGGDRKAIAALARIVELVLRLVHGEERNEILYDSLTHAYVALAGAQADTIPVIEILCVARTLFALGYLSSESLETNLFASTEYGCDELREVEEKKDELLASINRAIAETQL